MKTANNHNDQAKSSQVTFQIFPSAPLGANVANLPKLALGGLCAGRTILVGHCSYQDTMNAIKKLVVSLEPLYPAGPDEINSLDPEKPHPLEVTTQSDPTQHPPQQLPNPPNDTTKSSKRQPSSITRVLHSILRIPYNVVIRPVLLAWLLVTFPFTYFFDHQYPAMDAADDDVRRGLLSDIDEKTALLKREKIMANHIKSPTASNYIIPPPPRLFPRSRNPEKPRRKKTLVLDLDETLVHSLSRGTPRSLGLSGSCHMVELKVNSVATLYYVYKRPFCDFFLREILRWFELRIFTASVREYADPIIDWLESEIGDHTLDPVFTKRYYRDDCTYRPGVGYIKDLSKIFVKDDDLKHVVMLDNSPISYALQEHNGVMIEGWINDQGDRDLLNLLPMLYSLSMCIDVRYILGLRSGEKLFEDTYKR